MNIAVIPARGGSKRIPKKNLKLFRGKPIIAYSIDAAFASGQFERVIVSTDDREIADYALARGAEVPFMRPAALSDDHATTVPVVAHAIDAACGEQAAAGPMNVCCLYATAPFVRPGDLSLAHQSFVHKRVAGYVFTATAFPFPIQRAFRIGLEGRVEMFDPSAYATRSQDLEPAYQDAGQFYWGSAVSFRAHKMFFSTDSVAFLLPRYRVQDIDTHDDWRRAELVHQALETLGEL